MTDLSPDPKPDRAPTSPLALPGIPAAIGPAQIASAAAPKDPVAVTNSRPDQVERRNLIVGREISLSGQIASCDRLVVEGTVEVTVDDCRDVEICAGGLFKGSASVDNAEVSGRFEGELIVRKRLLIRADGHVSGTVAYGEIEIERGGRVSGRLTAYESKSPVPFLAEPAFARGR